jgi:uncharacterized C2H2 Zn-finger protein
MNSFLECDKCKKVFTKKYDLTRHVNKQTCALPNIEGILNITIENNTQCPFCSLKFDNSRNMKRHLENPQLKCFHMSQNEANFERIENMLNPTIINNGTINSKIVNNKQTINNQQTINNIAVQPITNIIFAKHGEETISHITKEVMLGVLNIKSFTGMCTELMRLLYFNSEVPENQNWAIVYPKNKNAGVELNPATNRFERKSTYDVINDKFSNMVSLLFPLVMEISEDDKTLHNLNELQKRNIDLYGMHYGMMEISKESEEVYESIHNLAYNSRKTQMEVWKEQGHKGNHLSLKF